MLDWTDRHYRYMARLISKHQVLYTEMVTTGAILHGKGVNELVSIPNRFLSYQAISKHFTQNENLFLTSDFE